MIKLDFESPKNREKSLADFKSLLDHSGWKLVEIIVLENIEKVKEQILDGLENESVDSIKRLRDKVKAYQDVINTPKMMINKLKPLEEIKEENDDVYD